MHKKLNQFRHYTTRDIFSQAVKVFLILVLIITTTSTGLFGNSNIDIAEPVSANTSSTFKGNLGGANVTLLLQSNGQYTISASGVELTGVKASGGEELYFFAGNSGTATGGGNTNLAGQTSAIMNSSSITGYIKYYTADPWGGSFVNYGQGTLIKESSGGSCTSGSSGSTSARFSGNLGGSNTTVLLDGNSGSYTISTSGVIVTEMHGSTTDYNNYIYTNERTSGTAATTIVNKLISGSTMKVYYKYYYTNPDDFVGGAYVGYGEGTLIKENSSSGTCTSTPTPAPAPTTTTVYPKTCASGLTPKGTPGTANFYCEKPVKVTEKEYIGANDINLENIMGEFGSNGERADGQFNLDSGNHNNGWYLNGNGDSYKSNHVQFTNIPDNGHVNAVGNSWQPEYLITQGKLKIEVPKSPKATAVELQKRDTDLNTFKSTKSLSEVLAYKVTDLDKLKQIQNASEGLSDLFTKTGSTYKYGSDITSHIVNSQGEGVYNNFKINESGYYIIASKYVDMVSATKEQATPSQDIITKHTYYSFIPVSVNFMTDLGYLPIQNNLLTQINDSILTVGNKKANHKLPNLEYQTYKSLKAPSAYNHTSNKTLIGSTSGGLQLLNKELAPIAISTTTDVATLKISDVVEQGNGFFIASDKGIHYLDCTTNELTTTPITQPVNDLELSYDVIHYLTDNKLYVMFVVDGELINSNNEYDLSTMFKDSTTKAGRVEVVGNLITVSSKDDSANPEVITLAK